jgi:hypothetical protein
MGRDDFKFMVLVEFVCLLNALQTAAPSPEPIKTRVFVVRGQIALKGKHGIDRIDVIGQRAKEGIVNNPLPGFISQCFSVRLV